MAVPIRVLLLEDSAADAELVVRELRKAGIAFEHLRVDTREAFERALGEFSPGLILSDYALPDFDGGSAQSLARERNPDVPFIFVSGSIGEEEAVEALRRGATDYVLKERLQRLGVAVRRALAEVEERAKREKLEERLRQAQKMEAIGRLAGGIAHDFNNLLTVINGYSQLLLARLRPDDPSRGSLEEIKKAGDRAAALTRQLLVFSRKQAIQPKVLDLRATVGDMDRMLRRLIGEDIELVTVFAPALGLVKADPGHIEQVLLNLAVNARDAMPQGGKMTLETSDAVLDEPYASDHAGVRPGAYVMLAVSDTGCGMDAETQSRIFEPFFTTKGEGKGTGLGLSTVYGIVTQYGGHISVYSAPGRGTSFKIYLPRVSESAEAPAGPAPAAGPASGTETVLVVEDEEKVRGVLGAVLRQSGYTVLEAGDGSQAYQICQGQPGPIHLMIVDMVMPHMSGRSLVELLAALRPDAKTLYMSGYTEGAAFQQGALEPGTPFLQKPFASEALARKVREVLDGEQGKTS